MQEKEVKENTSRGMLHSQRDSHYPIWSARNDPYTFCTSGSGGMIAKTLAGEAAVLSEDRLSEHLLGSPAGNCDKRSQFHLYP